MLIILLFPVSTLFFYLFFVRVHQNIFKHSLHWMPFRLQITIYNTAIKIHVQVSMYALIWPIEQIPLGIRRSQSQQPGLL